MGSFHRASIEAREKASEAAAGRSFLLGRYRAAGSALHERAPLLRLHSAPLSPPLFSGALLCQEQGSAEKEGGITPFLSLSRSYSTRAPKAAANEVASAALGGRFVKEKL